MTLVNIYGPNQDQPDFYNKVYEALDYFNNSSIVICGDFNLVLKPNLDYDENYKNINNPRARDKVLELMDNCNLIDIFREQHGETRR